MIDWLEYAVAERKQYREVQTTIFQKFVFWAERLQGIPYGWGKENLLECDCSGSVCLPLLMMEYDIRMTADDLYRQVFTDIPTEVEQEAPKKVMAVFYGDDEKMTQILSSPELLY